MRSQRSAASRVKVRQRACGALPTSRRPRAARPCVRVMLVLAQVSSMKTRRRGSSRCCQRFQRSRRRVTSGRSCSLARRLFFEAHALLLEEAPDRVIAHPHPALGQLRRQCPQRQVRLSAIRASSQSRSFASAWGRRPPIGRAAALPVARQRCDHFTALATLTSKRAAAARQLSPDATAATTRSRKSRE